MNLQLLYNLTHDKNNKILAMVPSFLITRSKRKKTIVHQKKDFRLQVLKLLS